jgi:CheY-like chemotaxis protein
VQSEPGTGTCFHLAFPLSDSAGISAETPAPIPGTGRILLVDDDDLARAAGKAQLERLGYEVTTAAHGLEGLRVFQSSPDAFDLVILDMAMPEMSGCDCFSALRAVRADVRVVLTSGLIQAEELDRMVVAGLRGFLAKPFRTAELSRVVHEAMTGD